MGRYLRVSGHMLVLGFADPNPTDGRLTRSRKWTSQADEVKAFDVSTD
jgi:hypothetical protein